LINSGKRCEKWEERGVASRLSSWGVSRGKKKIESVSLCRGGGEYEFKGGPPGWVRKTSSERSASSGEFLLEVECVRATEMGKQTDGRQR